MNIVGLPVDRNAGGKRGRPTLMTSCCLYANRSRDQTRLRLQLRHGSAEPVPPILSLNEVAIFIDFVLKLAHSGQAPSYLREGGNAGYEMLGRDGRPPSFLHLATRLIKVKPLSLLKVPVTLERRSYKPKISEHLKFSLKTLECWGLPQLFLIQACLYV